MSKWIAAAWIVGSAAGALAICVVLFGCCIVPFHGVLDHSLPLCAHFAGLLGETGHHHQAGETSQPAPRPKADPRGASSLPVASTAGSTPLHALLLSPAANNRYALRNLRSLGAMRVDDDVGLQALLSTFLI